MCKVVIGHAFIASYHSSLLIPVGIALTDDQLEKLCKFNSIADGYNVCQNVNSSDGTPNVLVTSTLDLMCDAVREALDFKCSR